MSQRKQEREEERGAGGYRQYGMWWLRTKRGSAATEMVDRGAKGLSKRRGYARNREARERDYITHDLRDKIQQHCINNDNIYVRRMKFPKLSASCRVGKYRNSQKNLMYNIDRESKRKRMNRNIVRGDNRVKEEKELGE